MKKLAYFLALAIVCACNTKEKNTTINNPTSEDVESETVVVYDTVKKELNKGEQLLLNARKKLQQQKELQTEVKVSENRKLVEILMKYKSAGRLSQKELEGFLRVNPEDLQNSAELSAIYNEVLFNVIANNNKMFASELVKQPELSIRLAPELSNPVDDRIQKDLILKKTRDEYQIQIDNRINELDDERLLIQYYIEKQNVFKELEGNEVNISTPQKIRELDQSKIKNFERTYKIENRIPDKDMGVGLDGLGTNIQPAENSSIQLEGVQVDLNKLRTENQLEEKLNQEKLEELKKIEHLQEKSDGCC